MKGILKRFELKKCETKAFGVIEKLVYECDVKQSDGDVKRYKGEMWLESARKYFEFAGRTTKTALGEEVEVILARKEYEKDGESRTYTYIKYLNFLDKNGEPIIMRKNKVTELDF